MSASVAPGRRRRALPPVAWAMLAGTVLRLGVVVAGSGTARFATPDSASYLSVAERLPTVLWAPQGRGYIDSLQRPPGYPVFLWLVSFGGAVHPTWVVVLQCLIGGALTVWLTWRLAGRWFGATVALAAATIVAVDPVSIGHSAQIGTETVFTALLVATLLGLERLGADGHGGRGLLRGVVCGVAIGSLALVRPVMVYAVPVLALVAWVAGRDRPVKGWPRLAPVLVASLVAVVVVGVWFGRNAAVADRALFSTTQGQNLFDYGAAAAAVDDGDPVVVPADPLAGWAQLDEAGRRLLAAHPEATRGVDMSDPVNQNDVWGRLGRDAIVDHPVGYVRMAGAALIRAGFGPGHTQLQTLVGGGTRIDGGLRAVSVLVLAVEGLAALIGTGLLVRRRATVALSVLLAPVAYYLVVSAGPQMYARFRVPVVPMLAVLAGVGIAAALDRWNGRRAGQAASNVTDGPEMPAA